MGTLTEIEIFACLSENFRLAAECCEKLAVLPRKGPSYKALRTHLELIEGACRQAAHWRGDARWLRIGMFMGEAHKRAGDWLRGIKMPDGTRVKIAPGHQHPLFKALAEHLRSGFRKAEEFRTQKTGVAGLILPPVQAPPLRPGKPVGWRKTQGGLILPPETVQ